jgi:bacterioferritin
MKAVKTVQEDHGKPASGEQPLPRTGQGLTPVDELRRRARQGLMDGALTSSYTLDPKAVVGLLNEALATELVCALRYKRHYYVAKGIKSRLAATEFLEHAQQEAEHADRIAERIVQLGGNPDFNPATLTQRAHASYHDGTALRDMIIEDLVAERIAIDSYRELVQYLGEQDSTTRKLIEEILAVEEEHAEDMMDLLEAEPASISAQ